MNNITGPWNPWNSCGPEVPQQPENDKDDDEKFEHERFLSIVRRIHAGALPDARVGELQVWLPAVTAIQLAVTHHALAEHRQVALPEFHRFWRPDFGRHNRDDGDVFVPSLRRPNVRVSAAAAYDRTPGAVPCKRLLDRWQGSQKFVDGVPRPNRIRLQ